MSQLTQLEKMALERAFDGPQPWMPFLRAQVAVLEVNERRSTGVGLFVEFARPVNVPPVPDVFRESVFAPSIEVAHPSLPHGGSFVVWVRDGFVETLECVANAGDWPEGASIDDFTFE